MNRTDILSLLGIFCMLACSFAAAADDGIKLSYDFETPSLKTEGEYTTVEFSETAQAGTAGEPQMPVKTIKVLLPAQTTLEDVKATPRGRVQLNGEYVLYPAQQPVPTSKKELATFTEPNPDTYESDQEYPAKSYEIVGIQELDGYRILILDIYPATYNPKNKKITYYKQIDVSINVKPKPGANPKKDRTKELVSKVENPEQVGTYSAEETSTAATYVVITSAELIPSFQTFLESKENRAQNPLTTAIFPVENITANPAYWCSGTWGDGCGQSGSAFNDTQAKIRNFIKHIHSALGTEYVLLAGDDEIIPVRYLYAFTYDNNIYDKIPGDSYYAGLNGNWDTDQDGVWGERLGSQGDEGDLYADVYVGRVPVATITEAENWINKQLTQEDLLLSGDTYLNNALMLGETLDSSTSGGDAKDLAAEMMEPEYNIQKLYDKFGNFSKANVISAINSNTYIINHNGHANYWIVMDLYRTDADNLQNTKPFFAYSEGCISSGFDTAMSGSGDSMGEHFIYAQNGAFAYIGNTRYGWYYVGSTSGPGDIYDRSFYDAFLNEGITQLGPALEDSKQDVISTSQYYRWEHYSLNLFGDPEASLTPNGSVPPTTTTTSTSTTTTTSTTTSTTEPTTTTTEPTTTTSTTTSTSTTTPTTTTTIPPTTTTSTTTTTTEPTPTTSTTTTMPTTTTTTSTTTTTTTSTTTTLVSDKCWAAEDTYAMMHPKQLRKFCKCTTGTYGYTGYTYASKTDKSTLYVDTNDNLVWNRVQYAGKKAVSSVRCANGVWYETNKDYYYP